MFWRFMHQNMSSASSTGCDCSQRKMAKTTRIFSFAKLKLERERERRRWSGYRMTESKGGKAETLLCLRLPAPHTLVGHLSLPARLPKPLPRPVNKVVGFLFPWLFPMSFGFKQTCAKKRRRCLKSWRRAE